MTRIQRITLDNISLFKAVRLRALQDSPSAFGSTYAREVAFTDEEWRARVERWNGDTGVGFLALDGEAPCGIAGAILDETDCSQVDLVSMWTAPTHRSRGVGRLLVEAVMEWARLRNTSVLKLMVTNTNKAAIGFYLRMGFAMTGRTEPYPNDPALTELEMALSVECPSDP